MASKAPQSVELGDLIRLIELTGQRVQRTPRRSFMPGLTAGDVDRWLAATMRQCEALERVADVIAGLVPTNAIQERRHRELIGALCEVAVAARGATRAGRRKRMRGALARRLTVVANQPEERFAQA